MAARYFGMAILVVLAVVMLTRSSSSSTEAYTQNQLRKEVGKAAQEIEQLKLEAKRAQTIQEIQNTNVKDGMQPVKDAEFVETGEVAGATTDN
jgi:type II secretory pathway pseudopilin PulG